MELTDKVRIKVGVPTWILSLLVFIINLLYISHQKTTNNIAVFILLFDVLIGIIAWGIFVTGADQYLHKKFSKWRADLLSGGVLLSTLISGIAIVIFAVSILPKPPINTPQVQVASYKLIHTGLSSGSTGDEVKILQAALGTNKNIYPEGIISGTYGSLTQKAVMNFQKIHDLPPTGIVDDATANVFNDVYGSNNKDYYLGFTKNNTTSYTTTNNQVVNTNPIVNCMINANCGGGSIQLSQNDCNNSTCCQIGNKWYFYRSRAQCLQDQNASNSQTSSSNIYGSNNGAQSGTVKIHCSYSGGQYSYDYGDMTYAECQTKSNAYWESQRQAIPTLAPFSTNTPIPARNPDCDTVIPRYQETKAYFMANQYNGYSSSFEAMQALEAIRQQFQSLADSFNCNIHINL